MTRRDRDLPMTCRSLFVMLFLAAATPIVHAADAVRVGYFLDWPTPNLVAKADDAYAAALGVPVNWTAFETGTQMTEAFLADEIDLAYSQGLAPFIAAVNAGVPIVMIAAAAQYPANDCVVRDGSDIDRLRPETLPGATVALPIATSADFSFRMTLRALGVDAAQLTVIDRTPNDAAVALVDGSVDMACGFGAQAMAKMYDVGEPLMSPAQKSAAGIVNFDVVSVERSFADENPALVRGFLRVTSDANASWTASAATVAKVAAESGLDASGVRKQLADFSFPTVQEQRTFFFGSNGQAIQAMKVVGAAFASEDSPALQDYSGTIDSQYLR